MVLSTEPAYGLRIRIEIRADILPPTTFSTGEARIKLRLVPIHCTVELTDEREHWMITMPPLVLGTELPIVVDLDCDHATSVDESFLLVHDNSGWFFPPTYDPFTVFIVAHGHFMVLQQTGC